MEIKTVTILGANGTMGTNGSAIFASFGNAKVYMVSRDIQKSRNAIERAIQSVRAEGIRRNLIPMGYETLDECIGQSDLIFESVSENMAIKQEILQRVGRSCKPNAVISTGTSGLSITKLAKCLPENIRKNFFGIHFFNPPYNMPLCELISTKYADKLTKTNVAEYLRNSLFRTVVPVKDSPAFLANRIGFQFMNMALQYAEKYQDMGGVDYIDSILGTFTGRAMSPCATADFVGLDVHKAIVDNIYNNTHDYNHETFKLPTFVEGLIKSGRLGRKTNYGLFKIAENQTGDKDLLTYDIKTGTYRKRKKYVFQFIDSINEKLKVGDYSRAFGVLINDSSREAMICKDLLKNYVNYSIYVGKEVCEDLSCVDDAMATGFNWCSPLSIANLLFDGHYENRYDYRKFFKVG